MATILAVYENGVFRPKGPVDFPEHCEVELVASEVTNVLPPVSKEDLKRLYAIMSQSFDTVETNAAERHNEHQP